MTDRRTDLIRDEILAGHHPAEIIADLDAAPAEIEAVIGQLVDELGAAEPADVAETQAHIARGQLLTIAAEDLKPLVIDAQLEDLRHDIDPDADGGGGA